eukprot:8537059-Alexandrium_andersonii.AAC.1
MADSTVRDNMRQFVDELDFLMRLLAPGLYARTSVTKVRPLPPRFQTATELALTGPSQATSAAAEPDKDQ